MTQLEQNFFVAATKYCRKQIDWEQRRYEIAKDVLAAYLSNSCPNVYHGTPMQQAKDAVRYADALVEELKK